ncbi:hypothetical protein ABI59_12695 [Acidobacteria bacterium Mor1]|nr:hypothetical protein ABI59_12695 [Acidobacteria bacterium Mor1]
MKFNRRFATAALALALVLPVWATSAALAQDEAQQAEGEAEEEKGPGFWGNKFALYVEVLAGESASEDIEPDIVVSETLVTRNTYSIDTADHGRVVFGWKLPEEKGGFRVSFTGHKETDFIFDSRGTRFDVANPLGGVTQGNERVEWWNVHIQNGQLVSTATVPTWNPLTDDADGGGDADIEEITFAPSTLGVSRSAATSLQNQVQTLDLVYHRNWGGRLVDAQWEGGLRYFAYEGNLPIGSWLRTGFNTSPSEGFTDGVGLNLINFNQEATGIGPTGSAEIRVNLLRGKLVLYGKGRFAFIIQDMETDSGDFFTLVRDQANNSVFPVATRLRRELSKDVWHSGAEFGARGKLSNGLTIHAGYFVHVYHDAILLPTELAIPTTLNEAGQPAEALYKTRDWRMDGWRAGVSYQF